MKVIEAGCTAVLKVAVICVVVRHGRGVRTGGVSPVTVSPLCPSRWCCKRRRPSNWSRLGDPARERPEHPVGIHSVTAAHPVGQRVQRRVVHARGAKYCGRRRSGLRGRSRRRRRSVLAVIGTGAGEADLLPAGGRLVGEGGGGQERAGAGPRGGRRGCRCCRPPCRSGCR